MQVTGFKVYIFDKNAMVRDSLVALLTGYDYDVDAAPVPTDLEHEVADQDVVLLDIDGPHGDVHFFDAAQVIKMSCFEAKAPDIMKPFAVDELIQLIEQTRARIAKQDAS